MFRNSLYQIKNGAKKLLLITLLFSSDCQANADEDFGRKIYMEGTLSSGTPLTGVTAFGEVSGLDAACINCHRPSGMGSVEGNILIPPITGKALGFSGAGRVISEMNLRSKRSVNPPIASYSNESFAKALQEGINSQQRRMLQIMPHYKISDADVKYLQSYLNLLSSEKVPGVTSDQINLATVITPQVDLNKKQILINTINKFIVAKNANTLTGQAVGRRHMVTAGELVNGSERKWNNQIWELKGDPATWEAQLENLYQKEPIFAMVSGFSEDDWAPVAAFCDRKKIPSWFPIVNSPPLTDQGYTLYFNRGVMLESDVFAQYFLDNKIGTASRLVQIYSKGEVGFKAQKRLRENLKNSGFIFESNVFSDVEAKSIIRNLAKNDVLVLWLTPKDLQELTRMTPPVSKIFISGLMMGVSNSLIDSAWKKLLFMTYPYELPEKRHFSLTYFRQWMLVHQIEISDEIFQSQIYFSLDSFQQIIASMWNNINRDYLIERAENQLGLNETANLESRNLQRATIRPVGHEAVVTVKMSDLNGSTTVYPHMSLGPGQRESSKGAYVVKFKGYDNSDVEAITPWIIPNLFN
jgi:hypothetical protein